MGDGLTITGGANGLTARFDDLRSQASLLDVIADDLGEVASTLTRLTTCPDIAEAAVLCPLEAAQVEDVLLAASAGPHGAGVAWARAEESAAYLRFSIASYQQVDELVTRGSEDLAFAGGFAAGSVGVPALVASAVANPAVGLGMWAKRDAIREGVQEIAYDEPWTQEVAARMAPGFVEGGFFALLGGSPVLLKLISGGHWPTSDLQGAMRGLLAVAGSAGLLEDSGEFTVRPEGASTELAVHRDHFLGSVMREHEALNDVDGVVQIVTVQGEGGLSYIVQVPGTQAWAPKRGDNPVDLTTNAHLAAGRETQLAQAVIKTMRHAQIPPSASVMLTGHSQGGMVAAAIAANSQYRDEFNIKAVVTAGSPISGVPIPGDVSVLSVEAEQDLVPKLDGSDNPDRPNWVTVTRDLGQGGPPRPGHDLGAAHSLRNYRQTSQAIDSSSEASLIHWRVLNSCFFGEGLAQRYRVSANGGR